MITADTIAALLSLQVNVQLAHWAAPRLSNEHRALGKLYEQLAELTDQLVETGLGAGRIIELPATPILLKPDAGLQPLITAGNSITAALRADLTGSDDDGLLSLVADLQNALDRAAYLLDLSNQPTVAQT